jgi:hypothetical protein
MSAKKARKSRPRKQPAPSSTTERARSNQSGGRTAEKPGKKTPLRRALSPLEVQLRKALAEMGLARARRVFAAVEASFDD